MESPPLLTRPADVYSRRHVFSLAFAAIALGLSFTTGMMLADEGTTTVAIPVPVIAMAPAVAPAPAAPIQEAPPPAPVPEEPPPWRALAPSLDAACFGRDSIALPTSCTWDSGFPAISADGRTIAELVIEGPMGPTDASLVLHDIASSREVRRIAIAKSTGDGQDPEDPVRRAEVEHRVAAAQQVLAAGAFRALHPLGEQVGFAIDATEPRITGDVHAIHAEWSNETMRLVDPSTRTQLWRHRFSAPRPAKHVEPEDDCGGWDLARIGAWWDPQHRVVVARLLYLHGGCLCGETAVLQAFSL